MVNILCSLWGEKYTIDYVDKLYSMVKRNCPVPFDFYCQTDKTGFRKEVNVIPFLSELLESTPKEMFNSKFYMNNLPRLWDRPKLNYWKPNAWGITGPKIAFDIDIIIQKDLSPIFELYEKENKALTGRSWWHDMDLEALPQWNRRYGARNNGGFYMWQDHQVKGIWEDLKENTKFIYFCFHGGSDNFISNRHLDKFNFLSAEYYYSFNRGCKWPDDVDIHKFRKDKIICIFNADVNYPLALELHQANEKFPWIKEYWK